MGATTCIACGRPMFGSASTSPAPQAYEPPAEPAPLRLRTDEAPADGVPAEALTDRELPARPKLADDGPLAPAPSDGAAQLRGDEARPAPVNLPVRAPRTLCRICLGPCTELLTNVCTACQMRVAATPAPDSPAVAFGKKLGTAAFRPPPVRRAPSAGARAARAIFWGVLLVGAGLGVVRFARPPEPGADLARDFRADVLSVAFAMPRDAVQRYRTTLDVNIHREEIPSTFDTAMMTIFDLHQVSTHDAEVVLVRDEGDSALLDVRTACALVSQEGEWERTDGSMRPVYPWPQRTAVERVRVRADGPPVLTSGGAPLPARDVPPLFTFGHAGGPAGALRPGARWTTRALLPALVTRGGAVAPAEFDCRLRYVGRRVLGNRACAIVRLDATPRRELDERFEDLDRALGTVSGALAYDVATGLLVQADLEIDTSVSRGARTPDQRVTMTGTLRVTRD